MNFAQELIQIRDRERLSQSEMAKILGLSQQVYSNIENGKTKRIDPKIVEIVAEKFPLSHVLNEDRVPYISRDTLTEQTLQQKALTKTLLHAVAKINSKIFGLSVEDALEQLEQDTRINLKQLLHG